MITDFNHNIKMITLNPTKINEIVRLEKCSLYSFLADKWSLILIILKQQIKRTKRKSHAKLGVKFLVSKLGVIRSRW